MPGLPPHRREFTCQVQFVLSAYRHARRYHPTIERSRSPTTESQHYA
jgi:hypothetical protein